MTGSTVRFGIIGLGLMGREFASAAARWNHLTGMTLAPEIVSICSRTLGEERERWYRSMGPSIRQATTDYREVLANPAVEAVYIAVPHHLHQEIYCAAIAAGKHVMGEKPFGIDAAANTAIAASLEKARIGDPHLTVRCASQFMFIPALQHIGRAIEADELGQIIEVEAGFLHSSDLDPEKPGNWKRQTSTNGEYGCMGDLGLHACLLPIRAGWVPESVRAILSNIVRQRPDGRGGTMVCETWDNATLFCSASGAQGETFPLTVKTFRIAPGNSNTLYLNVIGTRSSFRFSTRNINRLEVLRYDGGGQNWATVEMGQTTTFPSITGKIFEFGFSDAILQMWGAYMTELAGDTLPGRFAGCGTVEEATISHRLFTAALESHATGQTISIT